jgi:hypothetical protein
MGREAGGNAICFHGANPSPAFTKISAPKAQSMKRSVTLLCPSTQAPADAKGRLNARREHSVRGLKYNRKLGGFREWREN